MFKLMQEMKKDLEEKQVITKINQAKGANFIQAKSSKEDKGPALKDESKTYWTKQSSIDETHAREMAEKEKRREEALVKAREAHAQRISTEANARSRTLEATKEAEHSRRRAEADKLSREDADRREKNSTKCYS